MHMTEENWKHHCGKFSAKESITHLIQFKNDAMWTFSFVSNMAKFSKDFTLGN